jgi:hypothetical protein
MFRNIRMTKLPDQLVLLALCQQFLPPLPVAVAGLEPFTLEWWGESSTTMLLSLLMLWNIRMTKLFNPFALLQTLLQNFLHPVTSGRGRTWILSLGRMRSVFYHCATATWPCFKPSNVRKMNLLTQLYFATVSDSGWTRTLDKHSSIFDWRRITCLQHLPKVINLFAAVIYECLWFTKVTFPA